MEVTQEQFIALVKQLVGLDHTKFLTEEVREALKDTNAQGFFEDMAQLVSNEDLDD
jgi:hypothetical protein